MESVMKLNSAQVEQTLTQFEAQVIPEDHPLVPQLNELFGNHTFFLDNNGLNVLEPDESTQAGAPAGMAGKKGGHNFQLGASPINHPDTHPTRAHGSRCYI